MKIGVLSYGIYGHRMTGIARYATELTRSMRALDSNIDITLLNPYPRSQHPWYGEFKQYPLPCLKTLPAVVTIGHHQIHYAAKRLKLDILLDPCGIAPFFCPPASYRRVTTIHDAVPFIFPRTQPLLSRIVFRTSVRAARYTADMILTPSKSAAADLISYAKIPPSKLTVVPLGITMPPTGDQANAHLLTRWKITGPYFLFVGALHPRKNIERIVAAYLKINAEVSKVQLVIAGPPSWGAHFPLKRLLASGNFTDQILFTGFVSDEELDALYRHAHALVFPSLYEGFGLPVLEAMARRTPVITSNRSSLPEVAGDAGLLVDPDDVDDIAKAMKLVLESQTVVNNMKEKGYDRAQQFSWRATAEKTLEVYRRLLQA